MVKRKENQNLDEWLIEGELAAATRRSKQPIGTQPNITYSPSTAESVEVPELVNPLVTVPLGVEVTHDEAARWFWSLLGQAGFEIW